MNTADENLGDTATATIKLATQEWEMQVKVTVPTGPTTMRTLLPVIQSLADSVVDSAVQMEASQGRTISCKKGCGACCSQLVPISEVEARHIGEVVATLPEPRRTEIRERFTAAWARLHSAGLMDKLTHPADWSEDDVRPLGIEYFQQGISCPFLEEGSCSIYADRPITCREYLVTSPAANCARPSAATIDQVPLPFKIWTAIARCDKSAEGQRFVRWVPLILAPMWTQSHPDEPPPQPGPELLREFFDHLTGKPRSTVSAVPDGGSKGTH